MAKREETVQKTKRCQWGFPGGDSGKELQEPANAGDGRSGFNPWVGKVPWRRAWQPTLVFLPGESPWTEEPGGFAMVHMVTKSQTRLKQRSTKVFLS